MPANAAQDSIFQQIPEIIFVSILKKIFIIVLEPNTLYRTLVAKVLKLLYACFYNKI